MVQVPPAVKAGALLAAAAVALTACGTAAAGGAGTTA